MHGFYNRIVTIDMSSSSATIEKIEDEVLEQCLGVKGLATRLLLERDPVGVDPLSPENRLIFATGPFCGGPLWGGSRYGAELWGMDNIRAEEEALAQFAPNVEGYRKPGAVAIGPAGENMVKFALIANDKWHCAGRTGAGAVMGSKRVKAIVFGGDRKREYFDPAGVAEFAKQFSQENSKGPSARAYKAMGTTMMVAVMNAADAFPAKYWSQGSCDHWEKISGETYREEHDVKPSRENKGPVISLGKRA